MKFLTAILLALLVLKPSSGATQQADPMETLMTWNSVISASICSWGQSEIYFHALEYFYGETPLFSASIEINLLNVQTNEFDIISGKMIMLSNYDTGTYTLAALFDNDMLCELATGVDFEPL